MPERPPQFRNARLANALFWRLVQPQPLSLTWRLLTFGTSVLRSLDTALEAEASKYYQAAWDSFAKDPKNALKQFGWPLYDPDQNTLVELGFEGNVSAVFGLGDEFDGVLNVILPFALR